MRIPSISKAGKDLLMDDTIWGVNRKEKWIEDRTRGAPTQKAGAIGEEFSRKLDMAESEKKREV